AMENVFRNYRIELKDGTVHEGFKQSESRGKITLITMGGGSQTFPTNKIKNAGFIDGQSVMPEIATSLPPEQVASIIAYLKSIDGNKEAR
ncbi:hypothetical protein N9H94_03465, partial [Akkermansiaceae bacterium]|nr:hypothetical protein [Akkermansiaceae bacterium]